DPDGGDRGGGAGGRALRRAVHTVPLAPKPHVCGEDSFCDAKRLWRPSRAGQASGAGRSGQGVMAQAVSGVAAVVGVGVSGAGKSTVGKLIAARLDCPFRDADSFHPPANIEKMSRGEPLTDDDRWPWLEAIAAWIETHRHAGTTGVVTCSALKRGYRDVVTA